MNERLKVLHEISKIEDKHCAVCPLEVGERERYCLTQCKYGLEIGRLGESIRGKTNRQVNSKAGKAERYKLAVKIIKNNKKEERITVVKAIAKKVGVSMKTARKYYREYYEDSQ